MNHPPKDVQPNVILAPIDIPKALANYQKYIPNQYVEKERMVDWVFDDSMLLLFIGE